MDEKTPVIQPVKPEEMGRWLVDKSRGHFGDYCSKCDARFPIGVGADRFPFCPMCGSPMDLGGRVKNDRY